MGLKSIWRNTVLSKRPVYKYTHIPFNYQREGFFLFRIIYIIIQSYIVKISNFVKNILILEMFIHICICRNLAESKSPEFHASNQIYQANSMEIKFNSIFILVFTHTYMCIRMPEFKIDLQNIFKTYCYKCRGRFAVQP